MFIKSLFYLVYVWQDLVWQPMMVTNKLYNTGWSVIDYDAQYLKKKNWRNTLRLWNQSQWKKHTLNLKSELVK